MIRSLVKNISKAKMNAITAFAGLFAGAINGLLGTGGGIAVYFFLSEIYAENPLYSTKDIFAMTLCSTFIMSLSSLATYYLHGFVDPDVSAVFALPALAGGVLGAVLLDRLSSGIFRRIFALLVIWAGISMMIKR